PPPGGRNGQCPCPPPARPGGGPSCRSSSTLRMPYSKSGTHVLCQRATPPLRHTTRCAIERCEPRSGVSTKCAAAGAIGQVGGALLTPGSLAIIDASFAEEDRGKAIGAWSGFGGIASAIGPFIGGYLVAGPGWRWVFLINLPLAAIVVIIAQRHVPESRDPHA